jgi:hypothetical protein
MNGDYIKECLLSQAVPDEIVTDAVYFMTSYGWRKGPVENIYILGVERGRWDYYWICFTESKELKFVSCSCTIERALIEGAPKELTENDIKLVRKKTSELILHENKNFLIRMFMAPELEYPKDSDTLKTDEPIIDSLMQEDLKPEKPYKDWESLNSNVRKGLEKYAIEKLNDTTPLVIKLSKLETLKYNAFQERHRKCVSGKMGAIGGGISLKVTGTGLGWCFDCICNGCGGTEDITDISQW